jgi:D-3-phosphoglycerate dehydrogenase
MSPPRVLVADRVAEPGVERLREVAEVLVETGLDEAALCERLATVDALVVRSETQVTASLLEAGHRLKVVGRAGVGVDNIDVAAATRRGIVVVNSPEANTIAAAEHTIALLLAMARKIPAAVASLRAGEWRRGQFVGVEVYNKALGIIGLGKIGTEVGRRGLGLGMRVLAYDPFVTPEQALRLGAEWVELSELIRRSDFITVHMPLNRDTRGLLGDAEFAQMRRGVRILNCARGGIVDEEALRRALDAGQVAGAALDVFETEPPPADFWALADTRVVVTPHLGASTEEAQVNVALDVAEQILAVLDGQPPRSAVNMPAVSPEIYTRIEPYLRLGTKIGRMHAQFVDSPIRGVDVTYHGDLLNLEVEPITRAILVGLLQPMAESVNFVNAPFIAESRGIRVTESKAAGEANVPNLIAVEVQADGRRRAISGTVRGPQDIRILEIDQFRVDAAPEGYLLFCSHVDRPGIIGSVGTILGTNQINIASMQVGREGVRKRALMVLNLDDPVPAHLLLEIQRAIEADYVRLVEL